LIETTGTLIAADIGSTALDDNDMMNDSKALGSVDTDSDAYWLLDGDVTDVSTFNGSIVTTVDGTVLELDQLLAGLPYRSGRSSRRHSGTRSSPFYYRLSITFSYRRRRTSSSLRWRRYRVECRRSHYRYLLAQILASTYFFRTTTSAV